MDRVLGALDRHEDCPEPELTESGGLWQVVTQPQMFIVAGTALVTMLVDLNAAVISFTLFFHLVRLKWELPDMRLDDPEEGTEEV